jgi:hypothetical protein
MSVGAFKVSCKYLGLLCLLNSVWACGNAKNGVASPPAYYLSRPATNQTSNSLIIKLSLEVGYQFTISGINFDANVALDELHPLQEEIELSYQSEGTYHIHLSVYQNNGTLFIQDTLSWEYSLEPPPNPILSFTEDATSDANVVLLVAASRGEKAKELWVEGDLGGAFNPLGQWISIPSTGLIPLVVSEEDGEKVFQTKLRNIYGNESEVVIASILKKSDYPEDCQSFVSTNTSSNGIIRLQISAQNNGPLYYLVTGDIREPGSYSEFMDEVSAQVRLSQGDGLKEITVHVRDIAQNHCSPMKHRIDVNPSYTSEEVIINEGDLWTDDRVVSLQLLYDHLPGDDVEMYISGDIDATDKTFEWVPYEPELTVHLRLVEGNRFVRARFRRGASLSNTVHSAIFLRPYVFVQGTGGSRTLLLSEIIGLVSMSISGCQEAYNNISFQDGLACTPNALNVTVQYRLNDGTTVSRTTPF